VIIENEGMLTGAVLAAMQPTADPRLRQVMDSLVRHLHAFIRDVRPTDQEFERAVGFVAGLGQATTDTHNEVILASDVLGASTLIGLLNNPAFAGETEAALLGPFWRANAPDLPLGGSMVMRPAGGLQVLARGRVTDKDGAPVAGALLDVWQADPAGFYDNQDPTLDHMNLRGRFRTDAEGKYWFTTVKPSGYPVPLHGPMGEVLTAQSRAPYRPAHVHFMVSAPGWKTLITQVFADDAEHLHNDVTFSVIRSLVAKFERHETLDGAPDGFAAPWCLLEYDFVLTPGESRFPKPPIR
jgi:catechol 1,2-dioxygenase